MMDAYSKLGKSSLFILFLKTVHIKIILLLFCIYIYIYIYIYILHIKTSFIE